jgi:hypothetical protein
MGISMATQEPQKILRLGVIQGGNIVEEKLLRVPETVTVGQGAKNTFTVVDERLSASQVLLESAKGRYILHFDEKMSGRILVGDAVHDLTALREAGKARKSGAHWVVELDPRARGKVVVGSVTVLFQFVNPPPLRVAPQLPAHMRGGLLLFLRESVGFSGGFIGSLLLSVVLQGGFLAYLMLVVPPPKRRGTMDALPDRFISILTAEPEVPPPPDEPEPDETEPEDTVPDPTAPVEVVQERPREREVVRDERPRSTETPPASTSDRIRDTSQTVRQESVLGVLTTSDDSGVAAIAAALDGRASSLRAEDVLANQAVLGASGEGITTRSIGTSGEGTTNVGRAEVGRTGGGSTVAASARVENTERAEQTVEVRSRIRGADERLAGSGNLSSSNVAAVFRRREGDIRRCYERGLARNPSLGGRLVIQLTVGDGGRVDDVTLRENELGSDVGTCVVGALRRWRFDAPSGGSVFVQKAYILAPGG